MHKIVCGIVTQHVSIHVSIPLYMHKTDCGIQNVESPFFFYLYNNRLHLKW